MMRREARLDDVLADVASRLSVVPDEAVPVDEAFGRVLADPVACPHDLPETDRAAMDGFAVRGEDVSAASAGSPVRLEVMGSRLAGDVGLATLEPRAAIRIATGASLPRGADTVVRRELVDQVGDVIEVSTAVDRGSDVRQRGDEAVEGQQLLARGTIIRATQVAALAGTGVSSVHVRRRIRVGILISGSEVDSGEVEDALGPALTALFETPFAQVGRRLTVPDDLDELTVALGQLAAGNDLVLTTGGVSVGPADLLPAALQGVGECASYSYDIHPGRPGAVGHVGDVPVVCLPGNPGAALLQAVLLAVPLVSALAGIPPVQPEFVRVDAPIGGRLGRRDFVPVARTSAGVEPVAGRGSGNLLRVARTEGWVEIPPESDCIEAGTTSRCWWADAWTR